jgi:drug/metabolite transporter, DME family
VSNAAVSLPVRRGLAYLAFAGITWGTAGTAVDLVYRSSDLGPIAVSFWRCAGGLALLVCAGTVRRIRAGWRVRDVRIAALPSGPLVAALSSSAGAARVLARTDRAWVRVGSGLGMAVFQTAYFGSVAVTGVAVGTIVTLGAGPVLVAFGARIALGERLGAGVVAVVIAAAGLLVLVLGNAGGTARPLGVALALGSAAGYAVTTLLARSTGRVAGGDQPSTLAAWAFGIGALALLPWGLSEGLLLHGGSVARTLILLGYVIVVPTALAYPLYFAGAAVVRAATTATVLLLEPVSAAVLAPALLGERLTAATLVGAVLLLVAVIGLAAVESRASADQAISYRQEHSSGVEGGEVHAVERDEAGRYRPEPVGGPGRGEVGAGARLGGVRHRPDPDRRPVGRRLPRRGKPG